MSRESEERYAVVRGMSSGRPRDCYFRMLDYHRQNVSELSVSEVQKKRNPDVVEGRRAFVVFKLQLRELLKIVRRINEEGRLNLTDEATIDIAYAAFYYGVSDKWRRFLLGKLQSYTVAIVMTDELLKNLPLDYLELFDQRIFFRLDYEEEELD